MLSRILRSFLPAATALLIFAGCNNNPYEEFPRGKVIFSAIGGDPRTLDPTRVGDTSSSAIASNLHDTPYEYHYLKRPLRLKPSMATSMPRLGVLNQNGRKFYTFEFRIKKGLRYADDSCFEGGRGREILIDDIIFAIKRTADSTLDPFGLPLLMGKIYGFDEYNRRMGEAHAKRSSLLESGELKKFGDPQTDPVAKVYQSEIPGVQKLDDYTLRILLNEPYPQLIYFFSLTVGSPIPGECVAYYNGRDGRPTYDRHPATSGPYYLKEWHANYRMVLARNPNYRKDDLYPSEGMEGDEERGLLKLAGQPLPLVDEIRFQVIKAGPPVWSLFEQGYLDRASIPREVFDQVIQNQDLSEEYLKLGIKLDRDTDISTYWWYFNMKDPVLGKNRTLRQALSLAVDRREMLERFQNNRGIVAQSLIPPGIEGYSKDFVNPYSRFDPEEAKRLLARAGYPGGIDPDTGKPLRVTLILPESPASTSLNRFYIDQFEKINVELKIEQLDWPTVLKRKNDKNFQMIHGGWHADYPDPQNFFQLFYGPNASNSYNENSYSNPQFDRLYERMQNMSPGKEREEIIRQMNDIVARDAHVLFLFHPIGFGLSHQWVAPLRPHPINSNQLKYRDIDAALREKKVREWNRSPWWAYIVLILMITVPAALIWVTVARYSRRGR